MLLFTGRKLAIIKIRCCKNCGNYTQKDFCSECFGTEFTYDKIVIGDNKNEQRIHEKIKFSNLC